MKINSQKIVSFISELEKLEEKYGVHLSSSYEEEVDYDYDELPYTSGVRSHLVVSDESGFSIPLDNVKSGSTECLYCGRNVSFERENIQIFCNDGCETKYQNVLEKRKE